MTPELVERANRLIVSAPFSHEWRLWASHHGGTWDAGSKAWTFKCEEREAVEAAVERIFEEGE